MVYCIPTTQRLWGACSTLIRLFIIVSARSTSGVVFYCERGRICLICLIVAAKLQLTSALCVAWCLLLGEAGRAWGLGGGIMGRELVWPFLFFLFPLFYLSCHYVSSAVFNDGSSLQAVSGCTVVGGGDQWKLAMCFLWYCLWGARDKPGRCHKYRPSKIIEESIYYVLKPVKEEAQWLATEGSLTLTCACVSCTSHIG